MNQPEVGIGIVGFGYWGPKLLRNFTNSKTTKVIAVCDTKAEQRELARRNYPGITVMDSVDTLLEAPGMDAIAIATPVATHFEVARKALMADKHLFVEKPFTQTVDQAIELISLSKEKNRTVMVDHTFLYTPAVRKLREMVDSGELGDLLYYDSIRINLGLFQPDVDVIWDLAPHDFSILDYVISQRPLSISAHGASHSPTNFSDIAYITLDYGNQFLAHFHLNWLAPVKVRQILIGGSKKMVQFNDVLPDEKIRIYNRGIEIKENRRNKTMTPDDREGQYLQMISYRSGDIYSPWLDRTEALFAECEAFGEAVQQGKTPLNDGLAGLRVVLLLEAASRSLSQKGKFIEIDWSRTHA